MSLFLSEKEGIPFGFIIHIIVFFLLVLQGVIFLFLGGLVSIGGVLDLDFHPLDWQFNKIIKDIIMFILDSNFEDIAAGEFEYLGYDEEIAFDFPVDGYIPIMIA